MDKKKLTILLAVLAVAAIVACVLIFMPKGDTQKKDAEPAATVAAIEEKATETPTEKPAEEATEAPTEEPTAAPTEEVTEVPAEEPTAASAAEATEAPAEDPAEAPAEEAAEAPAAEATEAPAEETAEAPAGEAAEAVAETPAEETANAPAPDTLLATLNGKEIRENNEMLQYQIADLNTQVEEHDELIDRIVRMIAMQEVMHEQMLDEKIAAAGAEKTEAIRKEAQGYWNETLEDLMAQNFGITEDSNEEERIAARADALSFVETNYGYTEESYINEALKSQAYQEILDELMAADPSLAATEEEILQAYNDYAKEQQEYVGNDAAAYEFYQMYYGQEFYYIPEGYRGILHILLDVDQELIDKWLDLSARLEESQNAGDEESTGEAGEAAEGEKADAEPAVTEEPVTEEMFEAARQAILDSKKETIDEIMAKLKDGASFEDLIAEYNTDPGMDGDTLKNGYMVHKDSITFVKQFTDTAAGLEKIGDVSDPVVTEYGIHILYYLRDVPAGVMDMTDEVRDQMRDEIEEERLNLAYSEYFDKWVEENTVWTEEGQAWKYDQGVIDEYLAKINEEDSEDAAAEDEDADVEDSEAAEGA